MDFFTHYIHNFARNITHTFDNMDVIKWIRLVAIIGAYLLLRPYLEKIGAYLQRKEHEKELDPSEMGVISPNSLRGQEVKVPEESDEEPEAEATGANWGKKARKRQRQMLKKALEADEKKGREDDEDDRNILEQLVDYEEGKDGW